MNIDIQNKFGESSLHICSGQNKNLELSRLLIMQGANPNIKNNLGDSPLGTIIFTELNLDLAKRYGNHEIVLLFSAQEQSSSFIESGKSTNRRTR
jgi:ankyrin repeat protein